MPDTLPEPWLRGPLSGVHPLVMPVIHALMQAREDVHRHTAGLADEQVWKQPANLPPLGFHLRHIAGSLDRLTTYLVGRALHESQLAFLREESQPGASLKALIVGLDDAIGQTIQIVSALDIATLPDARTVGRKQLPTTVIGLAIHIAEHTQRHVGQVIATCQVLKNFAD